MKQILSVPSIPLTKSGYEKLEREQKELQAKRPHAVSELSKARAMGDLSENGYYKAARMELSTLDRRLRELAYFLQYATITAATSNKTVAIGCKVTVESEGQTTTYAIVGGIESNPQEAKLSIHSPIGKALVGKKVGDSVTITIPKGSVVYTIKEISI